MKKLRLFLSMFVLSMMAMNVFAEVADIFSTEDAPRYYVVSFKAGGNCIVDQGDGNNLKTAAIDVQKPAEQLWQFIGTPENFKMKSKAGNYVVWNDERFATSSVSSTELICVENANEGFYEIGRVDSDKMFNQWGGSTAGVEIGEWNKGDNNNPLQFIEEADVKDPFPSISTDEKEYWYYIQFVNGNWLSRIKVLATKLRQQRWLQAARHRCGKSSVA